jgi:hypothetical protein
MADEAQAENVLRGTMPSEKTGNSKENSTDPAPWLDPHRFKPGQSGNPSGRPKKKPLTEAYEALMKQPIPGDPQGRTFAEAIAYSMATEAIKGKAKVQAANEIADRIEGKPDSKTELSGRLAIGEVTDPKELTDEQLRDEILARRRNPDSNT